MSNSTGTDGLLASSVKGVYYLIMLQLMSRLVTFILHQIVLRFTSAETLGIASVQFELLLSTILFLSREGFRCALLRSQDTTTSSSKSPLGVVDTTPEGIEQKTTNVAYIPTCLGLITTILACSYFLSFDQTCPHYHLSVVIFGVAAMAELLIEPLFIFALQRLYFQVRVSVEGVAVVLRCLVTFGLTILGSRGGGENSYGVLAFAIAQLVFGITMMVGYLGFFAMEVSKGNISLESLYPRRLVSADGRVYWFDRTLLDLSITLTKQSLLKHVLTEGDKMLITALSTDENQGVYAFVVNYGSLVVRILFQPLEETGRTLFSKVLSISPDQKESAITTVTDVLVVIIRFHVLLGLLFVCFATNYTSTLIDLLVGKEWSTVRNAPQVLSAYCLYVPMMGINGITEAFVQSAASSSDLTRQSYAMIGFSICFILAGYLWMSVWDFGAIGLVMANMVNVGIRITYSLHFIKKYVGAQSSKLYIRQWIPHRLTVAAFAASWAITRWSYHHIGWQTLDQKAKHVSVGVACFGVVCAVIYKKEQSFLRDLMRLAKGRKQD
ncbi:Rft protein-domain-containing protein [Phycomyces nitens]|nr:Rft protein-domain-containing protein [Phycomyces nitens]